MNLRSAEFSSSMISLLLLALGKLVISLWSHTQSKVKRLCAGCVAAGYVELLATVHKEKSIEFEHRSTVPGRDE